MTAKKHERCDIQIEPGRSIKITPKANAEQLNEQQLADYREYRYRFVQWMRTEGKDPKAVKAYSDYTAYETAYRTARYDRYAWGEEGRYTVPPSTEHADRYIDDDVAYRDVSNSTKGKCEEALHRYHRWIAATTHADTWDREQRFNSSGGDAPRDYLTRRERRLIREASFESDTGWREPSLILTALDAALRPVEVKRARPGWVDIDNQLLRIPREDSSKNKDNWRVSLTSRTANALDEWLQERDTIEKYDDRDELWLTREGTQYSSRSLSRLVKRLCEHAGIELAGRSLTLYSLRHSTGTYLVEERDLTAAKDQLRHKSAKTTMKYDQVSPAKRRDALDKI